VTYIFANIQKPKLAFNLKIFLLFNFLFIFPLDVDIEVTRSCLNF